MRREHKWSASRIASELRHHGAAVGRCTITRLLAQLRLNRRKSPNPAGENNRESRNLIADRPGHMVDIVMKKTDRLPDGGGWRVHGKNSIRLRR